MSGIFGDGSAEALAELNELRSVLNNAIHDFEDRLCHLEEKDTEERVLAEVLAMGEHHNWSHFVADQLRGAYRNWCYMNGDKPDENLLPLFDSAALHSRDGAIKVLKEIKAPRGRFWLSVWRAIHGRFPGLQVVPYRRPESLLNDADSRFAGGPVVDPYK